MKRLLNKKNAALSVLALGFVGTAMADVPAAVTTALTGAATDGGVIAGAVLLVIVAIVALKYLRRAF